MTLARARSPKALAGRMTVWLRTLVLLVLLGTGAAQAETLETLIERHGFAPSAVSLVVEDVASGERLVAHRADVPGLPASTLKLATALVALDRLGPEHRFSTRVLVSGMLDAGGRLAGDVVLVGGGDPLLDVDGLMALALALRRAGVRTVAGGLVLDDTALPRLAVVNPRQPPEAAYNAGIGALFLAFNRAERLPLAGGGSLTLPPLVERELAWSRLPADRPATIPIQDAGLHAARVFRDLAASLGTALPPPERRARPAQTRLVGELPSRPLRDLVQAMLLHSNNQVAEIIGLAATGAPTLGESAAVMAAAMRSSLPAMDWRGFVVSNHSGLDPDARASAEQLLAILRLAEERHAILPLLPVAAWSGSLQHSFRHPATAFRVWGKTGSLDFANALVGYVLPESGRPLRLALLITDEAQRRERDMVELPTPAIRAAINAFSSRARDLRNALAVWALQLR